MKISADSVDLDRLVRTVHRRVEELAEERDSLRARCGSLQAELFASSGSFEARVADRQRLLDQLEDAQTEIRLLRADLAELGAAPATTSSGDHEPGTTECTATPPATSAATSATAGTIQHVRYRICTGQPGPAAVCLAEATDPGHACHIAHHLPGAWVQTTMSITRR